MPPPPAADDGSADAEMMLRHLAPQGCDACPMCLQAHTTAEGSIMCKARTLMCHSSFLPIRSDFYDILPISQIQQESRFCPGSQSGFFHGEAGGIPPLAQKQSTGLFLPAMPSPCSNPSPLNTVPKKQENAKMRSLVFCLWGTKKMELRFDRWIRAHGKFHDISNRLKARIDLHSFPSKSNWTTQGIKSLIFIKSAYPKRRS